MWKFIYGAIFCILWTFTSYSDGNDYFQYDYGNTTCGGNLTKPNGGFKLTMHNLSNPCIWVITPKISVNSTIPIRISLFFSTLYLLEDDSVTLYRSEEDMHKNKPLIAPLYGQNGSVTVVTYEEEIYLRLEGHTPSYDRLFDGQYHAQKCAITVPPDVQIIHSPISSNISDPEFECDYTFTKDAHKIRAMRSFIFEEFNFTTSTVDLTGTTYSGPYKHDPPMDFFPQKSKDVHTVVISVKKQVNTTEYFKLKIHYVDSSCSGQLDLSTTFPAPISSPQYILDNGTLTNECRWVVKHTNPTNILGLVFENLNLKHVLDIIAVNDGPSEMSLPLFQVTTSSQNSSAKQMIRSTGQYMWLSFKPVSFLSTFSANLTVHGQGGYFKNSGTISMKKTVGNDTIFLLEVEEEKVVSLNFTSSSINPPGKLDLYDGFDKSNLLASLSGNIWYPVLGRSSRLMAIATGFINESSFSADFEGISPGCSHMSTLMSENYILNKKCDATCYWIIPPQDYRNSILALDLQYVSLKDDTIDILKLDAGKTRLGSITSKMTHVPQLAVEANVGALVEIKFGKCKSNSSNIVLIGHSSYMPACGQILSPKISETFQIASPRYPDTYPLLAECHWQISTSNDSLVHFTFNSLKLASTHCIKFITRKKNVQLYKSETLPDDVFLSGETMIEFDAKNCTNNYLGEQLLASDNGFMINATVADCGAILEQKSGEFNTSIGKKSMCVWKLSIPETTGANAVNIISFSAVNKDDLKNYELHVYDGASVRDPEIKNFTASELWSRTNNLIVVYRRLNVSKPSSVFAFKYNTISCNSSMQCANKVCLHPDWRCNGINECGDFTDEINCAAVPIPPKDELIGFSKAAFWSTTIILFIIGILLGIVGLYCFEKRRNGDYRQFGNISSIE